MIKKNILKSIAGFAVIVTVCSSGMFSVKAAVLEPAQSVVSIIENGDAEIQANQLIWYTKTENGHTYKRLYNATTQQWVTDWILVS